MYLLIGLAVALLVAATEVRSEEVAQSVDVPKGIYVSSDNPRCGTEVPIATTIRDTEFQEAVGQIFGPKAQAIVVLVSQANDVEVNSGGTLAELLRGATGQKDFSSCAMLCVRTPPNAVLSWINLSNRAGGKHTWMGPYDIGVAVTGDHSGWRDVTHFKDEGSRTVVCATATNWSHNQPARKVLRVEYNAGSPDPTCDGMSKVIGRGWVPGHQPWTYTWNLAGRRFWGDHPGGGHVEGALESACYSRQVFVSTDGTNGQQCHCMLPRSGSHLRGQCVCGGGALEIDANLSN